METNMKPSEAFRLALQDAETESLDDLEAAAELLDSYTCPLCEGDPVRLGVLGRLEWFRCRNCGIDYCLPTSADLESDAHQTEGLSE